MNSPPAGSERRGQILDVAARLFAEQGVARTTVREIGDAAGVFSGSLYHYFESKEAIAAEIVSEYLTNLLRDYEAVNAEAASPRERLEGIIRISFLATFEHRDACLIYQHDHRYLATIPTLDYLQPLAGRVQSHWLDAINAGVAAGELRANVDPRSFYWFARDAVWYSVRWYKPAGRHTIDRLADDAVRVLFHGFTRR
jgi:AcrR family transcriptional regulator